MRHAICNIVLGVGGPVGFALAVGRTLAIYDKSPFPYFDALFADAAQRGDLVTTDRKAFLGRLSTL